MAEPTLADLKAFCAIAQHRSFGRAADTLGVSRSSLSHAMRSLEADLGVRILHRTTRSVSPTEAGERLLKRLTPVLRALDEALDAIGDDSGQPAGTLRINGNEAAIRLLLETVVPHFLRRYPRMAVDLVAEGRLVDIVEEGFDAGVRLAEAVPQDMIAIPLGTEVRFVAVAAPVYLANREPPFSPDDLRHHVCIRQRLPSGKPYRWEFERQNQQIVVDVPGPITLDSVGLMVEAAADGLGIAYVPESAARNFLLDGRLTKLLDDWSPLIPGLRLYYPGHRYVPVGLRAFVDLVKELQSTALGELMRLET
ncbi:LysR family transcriptional regulator [Mesorhizobium sp.]|uniref:LysR family transcriptional regulator n=1 Tax=Mesorhizobium sp. TaxID=1871066 RepID=UPI000FE2A388|nr:LysR family transcriptional regulator [Mesorhizobium sp.]RWH72893.1 MAG: LysR family transcriptional regulator [Mesorhizobium sp.]RWL34221.1 MAG: LysR family transcriptional regulator [Mesorhizobium sp.]RWL35637.1 MAG: LysR family transcriptional regulator [Mesorhizobium sp.]RWL41047.1 MAG: LysR family transcriptional regulator [Mesorhizobium sp.]RWL52187.1 MAG: LysR family transcriptional regulator [Mesorhizobium sp.]